MVLKRSRHVLLFLYSPLLSSLSLSQRYIITFLSGCASSLDAWHNYNKNEKPMLDASVIIRPVAAASKLF